MATNFPTSLDSFVDPTPTSSEATISHSGQHSNANDAIAALEAKVGANGSAVTTTTDYKLSTIPAADKAVSKTGTETLTNKTLTSPTINGATISSSTISGTTPIALGSDATGDIYYRNSGGNLTRLPIGSTSQLLSVASGLPSWATNLSSLSVITANASTLSMTTGASSKVIVWAKGSCNPASGTQTMALNYNAVQKDSVQMAPGGVVTPFALMYTETPGAGTQNITVTATSGTLATVMIIAVIIG